MDVRRQVRFPALVVVPLAVLVLAAGECNGAPNRPPVADAGEDQTVDVGELVTLDGGGSSDPDGDPLSFAWELETVPQGSAATFSNADSPAPSFTADVAGGYVATLTASDGELEASDSVSVTASSAPNEAPSLSSVENQRTLMNEPIEVPFTISDEDPDGVTLEASSSDATLVADGDLEVLGGGLERSLRIAPAAMRLGTVAITLVARDARGLEGSTSFVLEVNRPFATQFPKLTASDAAADDQFGGSVAISGDYAVIGAPLADDDGADSGSAYVFRRGGDEWAQSAMLPPEPPVVAPAANAVSAGDEFGRAVAIDGDYVIVGAPRDSTQAEEAGVAYVYERCRSTVILCQQPWSEMGALTANDAAAGDRFGRAVAISGDYALVGAYLDDDGGANSGSAYVFQRSGDAWNQVAKLTADDATASDVFGWSVGISGDYALIGAYGNDNGGADSGSAYVFQRSGDDWNQMAKLTANDAAAGDFFGQAVQLDGDYALIGAFSDDDDGTNSGSIYAFQRRDDAWNQTHKLTASDAARGDSFGWSVAISGDYAIVGALFDDDDGTPSGSGYVFQRSGDAWNQTNKLTASDAAEGDQFGYTVAIAGDYALIGAYGNDDDGADSGAGYVYLK